MVPVTHSEPRDPATAMELPSAVKAHLGMDARRSWIMLDEVNEFLWPGPDLRPVARDRPGEFAYGTLPPRFFARMRARILELAQERRLRRTSRPE